VVEEVVRAVLVKVLFLLLRKQTRRPKNRVHSSPVWCHPRLMT
jgi:hypothetical protein